MLHLGVLLSVAGCGQKPAIAPSFKILPSTTPGEWSFKLRSNKVSIGFVPVKAGEDDRSPKPPEEAWRELYKNVADDPAANELLKRLCRADSVRVVVAELPASADWLPEKPMLERSVVLRVQQGAHLGELDAKTKSYAAPVAHDFFRTGNWEPAPVTNLQYLDLAASDYMLRNEWGWVIFESPPAGGEEWTAAQWRIEVDQRIQAALE
jgi:hypothetical protein